MVINLLIIWFFPQLGVDLLGGWGGGGISQPTPPCGLSRQTIRFALFTCISLPPSREGTVGQTKDAGVYILGLDICHEECY